MKTLAYAARYLIPILREFPIWSYGPIYDRLDGRYIRDGWRPNWYFNREVSRAEAEAIHAKAQVRGEGRP